MNNPIYAQPSRLGAPILGLMHLPIDSTHTCIETIESCEVLCGYNFNHCSIIKYLWRLGQKDDVKKECSKILDYIDRAIARDSAIAETLAIVRAEVECLLLRQP